MTNAQLLTDLQERTTTLRRYSAGLANVGKIALVLAAKKFWVFGNFRYSYLFDY